MFERDIISEILTVFPCGYMEMWPDISKEATDVDTEMDHVEQNDSLDVVTV